MENAFEAEALSVHNGTVADAEAMDLALYANAKEAVIGAMDMIATPYQKV